MKLSSEFMLKEIADTYVLIPIGQNIVACKNLLKLNETGAFIMQQIEKGTTYDELLDALVKEYEAEEDEVDILRTDLDKFLGQAKEINAIVEE